MQRFGLHLSYSILTAYRAFLFGKKEILLKESTLRYDARFPIRTKRFDYWIATRIAVHML
jgi:hypothetical protein